METPDALLYLLRERKLNLKTIEHFQLGLSEKNRIAVPIFKNKELIDFKFRTLPPEPKGFSRCIGAQTWIFNDEGMKEGRDKGEVIVVEGEIDCMSIWQAGFTNVISLVGGAQSTGIWLKDLLDIDKVYICYEPGTKVYTENGLKNIEDITTEDKVLTHTGQYQKVYKSMKNQYNGTMVSFDILGEPISREKFVTINHPLLVYKKRNISKNRRRFNDKIEWIRADNVEKGDYLLYPIREWREDSFMMPIYKYKNKIIDRNILGQIVKSKAYWETENVLDTPFGQDKELFYLVGLFLGDGHYQNTKRSKRFELAYNTKTKKHIIIIKRLFEKYDIKYTTQEKENCGTLYSYDYRLSIFRDFYKNKLKIIPNYLWHININQSKNIYRGLIDSDGHINKTNYEGKTYKQKRFTNTNEEIIHYFEETCIRIGHATSTQEFKHKNKPTWKKMYQVAIVENGLKEIKHGCKHVRTINGTSYILKLVKKISRKEYNGNVYNIDVENDHSYITGQGVISHNCLDSDPVGQKAARNLADRIGIEKCINVKLPVKDANDFFKQYNAEDFKNVLRNSEKFPIQDVSPLKDLYDKVKESKSGEKDFQFYYQNLDELTKGFNKSNVIVVSAETSHGKSSWVLNVSANLGQHNIPVLYIPLEDNPTFLARRMFNILSGTEISLLDESEWGVLKNKIRNFPFYLYMAQSKFNLRIFKDIIEKGKKIYNINIFVLDHLHFLIQGVENNTEEVGYLMRQIVNIARSQNVTIFLVSHIRKKIGEGAWTKMPDMNALRSSGLIKGDAHMVIMLFKHFEDGKMIIDLAVQKNREGNITLSPLTFLFDTDTGIIKEHREELKEAKNYEVED